MSMIERSLLRSVNLYPKLLSTQSPLKPNCSQNRTQKYCTQRVFTLTQILICTGAQAHTYVESKKIQEYQQVHFISLIFSLLIWKKKHYYAQCYNSNLFDLAGCNWHKFELFFQVGQVSWRCYYNDDGSHKNILCSFFHMKINMCLSHRHLIINAICLLYWKDSLGWCTKRTFFSCLF